jgi:hypothetical protein
MSYVKKLADSDVRFGFVYIGNKFRRELPRGKFTLTVGEESCTV